MGRTFVLILGLVVLVVGGAGLVASSLPGVARPESESWSFSLEPGKLLRVTGQNGEIVYQTWEGDTVVVEATRRGATGWAERFWPQTDVIFTQNDRGVDVAVANVVRLWFLQTARINFVVKVPEGWHGNVTLTTFNGSISASQIHGTVTLQTSNGTVTVVGHEGSLTVRSSNGRVRLADIHGSVDARTSNGAVSLIGGSLRGAGRLRTSNGPVELNAHLEEGAEYEIITSNGAVTLRLIDPDVALNLRTSNGGISLQTDVTASSVGRNSLVGTIGAGAARLDVQTSNGSITVAAAPGN